MSEYPDRRNDEWNDLPVDMRRFATHFGPTDAHILLLGPPGSGKGYLARILHELSPRAGGPFVPQNCGVFTESLAEAQLFGFMKGAYTGATESKPGLVEAAAGGTLFLDEFGALPPAVQPMLLTFVETGEFNRMGSTSVREANLRIIAATNRNLGEAIRLGEFREDLVARLSIRYKLPPLRERREEIVGIADRYLRANGVSCELTEDAVFRLRTHDWRGNIRELVSVIDYCMVVAKDGLIPLHLVDEAIRNQQIGARQEWDEAVPGEDRLVIPADGGDVVAVRLEDNTFGRWACNGELRAAYRDVGNGVVVKLSPVQLAPYKSRYSFDAYYSKILAIHS